jgi:hypothetical protein
MSVVVGIPLPASGPPAGASRLPARDGAAVAAIASTMMNRMNVFIFRSSVLTAIMNCVVPSAFSLNT